MSTDVAGTTQFFFCALEGQEHCLLQEKYLVVPAYKSYCLPSRAGKGKWAADSWITPCVLLAWCSIPNDFLPMDYSLVCTYLLKQTVNLSPGCWMESVVILNSALPVGKWSGKAISEHKFYWRAEGVHIGIYQIMAKKRVLDPIAALKEGLLCVCV